MTVGFSFDNSKHGLHEQYHPYLLLARMLTYLEFDDFYPYITAKVIRLDG